MTLTINNRQARRLVLHLQGLSRSPSQPSHSDALYDSIVQLGFVQVDSIQWVERAHHMILFSRSQNYRPGHLHHVIEQQQRLFENYTHDASVIPSEFFPYWNLQEGSMPTLEDLWIQTGTLHSAWNLYCARCHTTH